MVITTVTASNAVNTGNTGMMNMMGMRNQKVNQEHTQTMMGMGSSMDDMMRSLNESSPETFDKAFLTSMIVHHQGAIEMAKQAQSHASHMEIKKLADEIIDAQTKEIDMMKTWQTAWRL